MSPSRVGPNFSLLKCGQYRVTCFFEWRTASEKWWNAVSDSRSQEGTQTSISLTRSGTAHCGEGHLPRSEGPVGGQRGPGSRLGGTEGVLPPPHEGACQAPVQPWRGLAGLPPVTSLEDLSQSQPAKPLLDSWPQKLCKIISICCFQLLALRYLVM